MDTEIVQQAPFLPLTKAVYEAIAALNKNNLPSSQQNVFEYLAHTYQYVHVPKPNVIRDSLGILFKEGKVFSSGTDYFVLVDTESDASGDNKKEKKTTSGNEKAQENHVRCVVCEAANHKTNSTHAQNVRNSKRTEHAHLCEKHKRGEKKNNKKENTAKETNLVNTRKESKDSKSGKKENKNNTSSPSTANHSKKVNEKTPKKTVWEQIAGFIKGKHSGTASETAQQQKPVSMNPENPEPTKPKSAAIPIEKQGNRMDSAPKLETQYVEEKRKPLDSAYENQTENPAQMQRSNSFAARTKKRPNLVRSNTFTAGSSYKPPRPVDYDIITSRIDEQSSGISTPDQHLTRPLTREYSKKSSLAEKAYYFNTNDFIRQNTSGKETEKSTPTSEALPQRSNSFRGRNSSYEVREAERFSLTSPGNHDSSRSNACAVGVVRPWSSHAPSARPDSRPPVSRSNSMRETRQFSLSSSCTTPTGDVNKPVLRDNRLVQRSLSLREYRNSDCTPLTLQRYAGSMNREVFIGDSPLKHLLTKNTGNTLSVSPSHPNYIPAIQDRSRNSTPNRNSFPSAANNSFKRHSWREASLKELDENHGCESSVKTGFSQQDEKPKRHEVFSFDYPNRYHLSKGVIPCDCSDAGYSENYERRSKDDPSSIYSNSDYGILLNEVSSSGSSEIQSIMNQEKTTLDNKTASPYTVAKGEVVLDSSLTFIGII